MILTHELDGPTLALFKDQSAKKLVENRYYIFTSRIRFGTTTLNLDTGITPAPSFFPHIKASEMRVHGSCFILIQTERLVRKQRRPHFIWLCAKSTQQLFDIVKAISSCLVSMKVGAPLSNPMDDINALHRYRPKPFEVFEEALPPIYELKRDRELTEKSKTSNRSGKSASSKKANRYTARRESALSNSEFESGDNSSVCRAFGNIPSSQEVADQSRDNNLDEYSSGPHSILKNKAAVQASTNPKYSSGSGGYTSSSTRSTHTQTPRKSSSSSRRRQSEMSVIGADMNTSYGSTPPYIAIQNMDYTDAATYSNRYCESTFIEWPCSSNGSKFGTPTAPIRKLTPTAPNPTALAAVAAAAAQNKQAAKNNISHFSSSDGGSMSSDFDDDDIQSNHTIENSSGASTPKMMSNEHGTEERIYRITVEGLANFDEKYDIYIKTSIWQISNSYNYFS
uniref:Uncharacterized protein n=1 Tax=Ditylenchus dipsaci TaxID=166011 RepID=A0A915DGS8_9BILA